ncbi:MAG: TRAP transporter small permease [Rhodobacteraceae bacterium]|nr:TRAP transporter small permease [Paracoccaceae bacterium]
MTGHDRIDEIIAEQEALDRAAMARVPFKWYDVPVLAIFLGLFGIVFLQFFTRYVLNDSVSWTEEAARYLLIALTFVGAIKCQLIQSHISLEFVDGFAGRFLPALKTFALAASTFFLGFCTWSLWGLTQKTIYQRMVSLPFPKYYLYSVVLAALVVLVAVAFYQTIKSLQSDKR